MAFSFQFSSFYFGHICWFAQRKNTIKKQQNLCILTEKMQADVEALVGILQYSV